jgi:hypothetical protein
MIEESLILSIDFPSKVLVSEVGGTDSRLRPETKVQAEVGVGPVAISWSRPCGSDKALLQLN